MKDAFRWNLLAALAIFAAVIIASPAAARAGCAHPWIQTIGPSSSLTVAELAIFGSSDLADSSTGFPVPAKHSSPCARGACSQPFGVPPSSSVPSPGRTELLGELLFDSAYDSPGLVRLDSDQGCDRPRRSVSPIERPPRRLAIG